MPLTQMSEIVFIDPQDNKEKFWWAAVIVDKKDYDKFFKEMGEIIAIDNDYLVCYFEDCSYSTVKKEDVIKMEDYFQRLNILHILFEDEKQLTDDSTKKDGFSNKNSSENDYLIMNQQGLSSELIKWLTSKSVKRAIKMFKCDKPPTKFKWLARNQPKENRNKKNEFDPGFRKHEIIKRAQKLGKNND